MQLLSVLIVLSGAILIIPEWVEHLLLEADLAPGAARAGATALAWSLERLQNGSTVTVTPDCGLDFSPFDQIDKRPDLLAANLAKMKHKQLMQKCGLRYLRTL